MDQAAHAQFEAQIHRHFTRGLAAEEQAALHAHVRECAACERVFGRYAEAEHGLYGGKANAFNPGAEDRVAAALFGAPAPAPRRWLTPALAGLAAAGALALALLAPAPRPTPRGDELRPRGVEAPVTGLGLRALRLRDEGGRIAVLDLAAPEDAELVPGDNLALLYVNLAGAEALEVRLEPEDGQPRVIHPRQPVVTGEDKALGAPQTVQADWPEGRVAVVGHFFGADGGLWTRTVWVTVRKTP